MDYKIDKITLSSNGDFNEDRLLISENIIGVIDGETPINVIRYNEYNTMTEWMVDNFVKKFEKINSKENYKNVAKNIIQELSKDSFLSNLENYDKPCFTSATITFSDSKVLTQIICDSFIYIQKSNNEIVKLTDSRHDLYEKNNVLLSDSEKAVQNQKLENKKNMNIENGYWTVAFTGDFENEFIEKEFNLKDVKNILICTDGFARLFEEFDLISPKEVLSQNISLGEAIKILRKYEEENYLNTDYPCVKKSDDATAVIIRF